MSEKCLFPLPKGFQKQLERAKKKIRKGKILTPDISASKSLVHNWSHSAFPVRLKTIDDFVFCLDVTLWEYERLLFSIMDSKSGDFRQVAQQIVAHMRIFGVALRESVNNNQEFSWSNIEKEIQEECCK